MHAERRLATALVTPAMLVIAVVAIGPILATAWQALHLHDLRLPWLGQPFIGLDNFQEAVGDRRLQNALLHTMAFATVSVALELAVGMALGWTMHVAIRGRLVIRGMALLPWAIPTVVAALIWRFMLDAQSGIVNLPLRSIGLIGNDFDWFIGPFSAWVPIVASDVWKTSPFVAILILAGLQTIDPALYEAARVDGASAVRQFFTITLPLLRPTLIVAATLRALDALRLFDVAYVLTGGGPGTATEPLSMYAFVVLMQRLRFGYGSALSLVVFGLTLAVAVVCARTLGRSLAEE